MRKLNICILLLFVVSEGFAQTSILPGNTTTQNFDAMGSSLTLPANWKMAASTSSPSWAAASSSVTTQASSGAPTTGGTYNWGSTSTERAAGAMSTGSFPSPNNLLSFFINSGATNITGFNISYDAERYRINSAAASVQFYYSLNGTAWVAVSAGDIAVSLFPAGANTYTFATPLTVSRTGISVSGLGVTPGSNFYLRWNINTTGANSQGIGIDNISVTAIGDAPPPALVAGSLNGFGNVCVGSNSTANSFTLSGSNLDGSQVTVGPLANYSLSGTASGPWTATLSPFYNGSSFNTTIYVRLSPTGVQFYDGNIPVSGGNAAVISVATTGAGINTAPTVSSGPSSSITQVSATIAGTITDNGCGNITSYGIEYSTSNGFANGSGFLVASSNLSSGNFSSFISGLSAGTIYYYHAVTANNGGTSYGSQSTFTTLPVDPITATAATGITAATFTANWNAVAGAVNYRLDVATTNAFIIPGNVTLVNWTFPNITDDAIVDLASALNTTKTISAVGTNAPAFNTSGATTSAARATGWDGGNGIKYWMIEVNTTGYYNLLLSSKQRSSVTGPKDFKAQFKIGAAGTWTDIPSGTITVADNFTSGVLSNKVLPAECNNQPSVFIRWVMTSNLQVGSGPVGSTGANLIDDILVTGNLTSCLTGYENLLVNGNTLQITGLTASTNYYYRVRAYDGTNTTISSNIITVTTAEQSFLPVSLISFSGYHIDGKNKLNWVTITESNNTGFEVQRSTDGINYDSAGFVPSHYPGGNGDEKMAYIFNDYNYTGEKQYYRLKQIDRDGWHKFSDIVLIRNEEKPRLIVATVYPNPVSSQLSLIIRSPRGTNALLSVKDLNGREVRQMKLQLEKGANNATVNLTGLQAGHYLLVITDELSNRVVNAFIKF